MTDRRRRALGELVRFAAVAQVAAWFSFLLFNVLTHGWLIGAQPFHSQPIAGYLIANCIGMVISYHGSRGWVFPDRPPHHADGGWTAYAVINVAAMAFPVACLYISRHTLGLDSALADNVSANVIGMVFGFGARYVLFKRFVFRHPQEPDRFEPVVEPTRS